MKVNGDCNSLDHSLVNRYGSGSKKKGGKRKLYRPIRNEFSYHAQFKNEGGVELLKNPDNTSHKKQ